MEYQTEANPNRRIQRPFVILYPTVVPNNQKHGGNAVATTSASSRSYDSAAGGLCQPNVNCLAKVSVT
jgi:hypothetical protein